MLPDSEATNTSALSMPYLQVSDDDGAIDDPQPNVIPRKKPRKEKTSETDQVMHLLGEKLKSTRSEDELDIVGRNIANKLRNMPHDTRILAEKFINDVLFEAEMGTLNRNYQFVVWPNSM